MPGIAFCSWISSGVRVIHAIKPPGPATNPPRDSTTSGLRRRRTRNACAMAYIRVNGSSSQRRQPLRRTPWIVNHSMSIASPEAGTACASRPRCVPSHTTCTRFSRSRRATASPGKTCPPVPPAIISTQLMRPPPPIDRYRPTCRAVGVWRHSWPVASPLRGAPAPYSCRPLPQPPARASRPMSSNRPMAMQLIIMLDPP